MQLPMPILARLNNKIHQGPWKFRFRTNRLLQAFRVRRQLASMRPLEVNAASAHLSPYALWAILGDAKAPGQVDHLPILLPQAVLRVAGVGPNKRSSGNTQYSSMVVSNRVGRFGNRRLAFVEPPRECRSKPIPVCLSHLRFQQLVHRRRVGLAFGRLHDRAYQEADYCGLAALVLFHLLGVGGDDVVDNLLDGSGVADLLVAVTVDNGARGVAGGHHLGEDLFGLFAVDLFLVDEGD